MCKNFKCCSTEGLLEDLAISVSWRAFRFSSSTPVVTCATSMASLTGGDLVRVLTLFCWSIHTRSKVDYYILALIACFNSLMPMAFLLFDESIIFGSREAGSPLSILVIPANGCGAATSMTGSLVVAALDLITVHSL